MDEIEEEKVWEAIELLRDVVENFYKGGTDYANLDSNASKYTQLKIALQILESTYFK